jgi:hypothetical protein
MNQVCELMSKFRQQWRRWRNMGFDGYLRIAETKSLVEKPNGTGIMIWNSDSEHQLSPFPW